MPVKTSATVNGWDKKSLNFTSPGNKQLIILRKLIHTEDGDDILQIFILLQGNLNTAGNQIMLLTDDIRIKNTGGGIQRINRRIDSELGNLPGKNNGSVKMGKGGCRSGVGQVVGRYVDALYSGNGTLGGRGNAFLQGTKVGGQGRLITNRRRNTTKKSGYLGTGLGKTEDVVNKEEHVLAFFITEILGSGQTGQGNTGTGTWRLGHLAVDQGGLGQNA